ncbi:MAG TPA: tyrosine-type recombinase/integrase [Gemmatimonadales bacterium]|jgi:hypothetical protein|nr:tyrosine-type recombinase/integrase [Gemmatimonadales bacterium]
MRAVFATYRAHLAFKAQAKLNQIAHLPPHLLKRKRQSFRKTQRAVDALERRFGDEPISALTYARLQGVATKWLGSYGTGSVRAWFALLHAALEHTADVALIPGVPRFPSIPPGEPRQMTMVAGEYELIQPRLPDAAERDAAEFLWLSGWRPSEPLLLTWPMFRSEPVPHFWLPLTKTRGRVIAIRQSLMVALIARRRAARRRAARRLGCDFVFHRNGRPLTYETFREHWLEAATAAGLPDKKLRDYRRARYDRFAAAGVDDEDARGIIGHESVQVASKHYYVKAALRQAAAFDRETAFENSRNTRAGNGSGKAGSPS